MPDADLRALVEAYLKAFEQRDLARCLECFADDATIDFAIGVYRGKRAIEEWHKDRFAADLRVTRIDDIRTLSDSVVVDAVATSKVARSWGIGSVAGTATFVFQDGKIKEATFGLRMAIPIEGW